VFFFFFSLKYLFYKQFYVKSSFVQNEGFLKGWIHKFGPEGFNIKRNNFPQRRRGGGKD